MRDELKQLSASLVGLGTTILVKFKERDGDVLPLLEQYVELFDTWERLWSSSDAEEFENRQVGERILILHDEILNVARALSNEAESSLKGIRGWSKGIRAYIDHFPSKISTRRGRKG